MTNATSSATSTDAVAAQEAGQGDAELAASLAHCAVVAKQRARNFYYGMKLTPEPKRSALYTIYAFMRACDDLADDETGKPSDQSTAHRRDAIKQFRARMQAVLDHDTLPDAPGSDDEAAMWPAFRHVVRTYPIDQPLLHQMLDGQVMDLDRLTYESFDQLYDYCFKVASVVGLVCISVWGYEGGDETRTLAEHRGIALQLTNILRDVVEDAERGRVYLPADELERFGCDPAVFTSGRANAAFDEFMAYQIDRARSYYRQSAGLEKRITRDCRGTCWAIMRIYRGLLDRIAAQPRRVLRQRVRLATHEKLLIGARARLGWLD